MHSLHLRPITYAGFTYHTSTCIPSIYGPSPTLASHTRVGQPLSRARPPPPSAHPRSPPSRSPALQVNAEIAEMRKWTEKLKQCILCFQTQVANPDLVSMCVRYYRLVSRWLVATANPPAEGLPLPEQVPRIFAALPEYLMQVRHLPISRQASPGLPR